MKKRTPATPVPSLETQTEAMKIAKATQKPGQTKEQTKLIAQGIEKGIAQYKKQQREKLRQHEEDVIESDNITDDAPNHSSSKLPWALLALSWIGFAAYIMLGK
ncbi:DUF2956 domain-containing protein [Vibrio parahaemolyticus]|uniref:DUF2956 domain-containing protein n=1 Tax=Vibrio parahaemolyticus TaxID=670 RepID=UPI001375C9CC|nr:DUF2956 domain-containing protein [Vibrio parahaemolyticus]MBM5286689.1 DUF2956 domain-containing protein [Vibrio parahaemolyticus]MCF9094171.1 DUF2956 domain-containing protein [Vibrio parahaemolyticus]MCF9103344.1 DUF2956 domain-containing protein [Vibrio parahaemolyticus]NCN16800.1 DUF2956 domain-containing protein [Vibrio parahaemolyticus]